MPRLKSKDYFRTSEKMNPSPEQETLPWKHFSKSSLKMSRVLTFVKTNKDSILVQYRLIWIQVTLSGGWEMQHWFGTSKESKLLTGMFQRLFVLDVSKLHYARPQCRLYSGDIWGQRPWKKIRHMTFTATATNKILLGGKSLSNSLGS